MSARSRQPTKPSQAAADLPAGHLDAVRRFNRFYTRRLGLLDRGFLASPFSLTEVRVLYELFHRPNPTAAELGRQLHLDAAYLSRMLAAFERRGLIRKTRGDTDGRRKIIQLTTLGRRAFASVNARQDAAVAAILGELSAGDQRQLIAAMRTIERLLTDEAQSNVSYVLRPHRPGDIGWITYRHGVLYNEEYGWDEQFEALVAEIGARFLERFDPRREACWIAERDGDTVGAVFCVRKSASVAQLRLLYVEPAARGLGIGARLVDECVGFARRAGYRKVILWTNSVLHAARRIYQRAGFRLVREEPHQSYGAKLVAQTWVLNL